jgi:hypothetical protein
MTDAAKQDVARYAMTALEHAASSWVVGGANLMTIVMTRTAGENRLQRVDMNTPDQSLATARQIVMEAEGIEAYAIAYLGTVDGERNDFRFGTDVVGQPAIVVEAGNLGVDQGGALAMALLIHSDDQGPYLGARPTHFTGMANWLRWREIIA